MASVAALTLLALAVASLVLAGSGVRLLLADWRLRDRLSQDRAHRRGLRSIPLPRMLLARGRDRAEIEEKLKFAGHFASTALDRFIWLRLLATIAVTLAVFVALRLTGTGLPMTLFLTFSAGGLTYIGAKYALHMRAASRERELMAEFPFLLDLMLMMLESGISLDQCFRSIARDERVAVPQHGPLVAMLVEDLDRGQDYQTAFDRWASRVAVTGARELATLFRQSLYHGRELAPSLREFITEFSQRRVARARENIGKITVRMVILMLLFFMPALFIVLAGPPVSGIFDTLRGTRQ